MPTACMYLSNILSYFLFNCSEICGTDSQVKVVNQADNMLEVASCDHFITYIQCTHKCIRVIINICLHFRNTVHRLCGETALHTFKWCFMKCGCCRGLELPSCLVALYVSSNEMITSCYNNYQVLTCYVMYTTFALQVQEEILHQMTKILFL